MILPRAETKVLVIQMFVSDDSVWISFQHLADTSFAQLIKLNAAFPHRKAN